MCGIAAIARPHGKVSEHELQRMANVIAHRGPDDEGVWTSADGTAGLAHRRLSIVDLAHGHQPMSTPDESFVLCFNGEIYNHAALRSELERLGYSFSTRCDTEVVLAAFATWGPACLERLDGFFGFVVWDKSRRRLFLARDRMGKKPVYFTSLEGGGVAVASEIKALFELSEVTRTLDREALSHYLSFLVVPAPRTLFAGIAKLPAGGYGIWSVEHELVTGRWWTPTLEPAVDVDERQAAEEVRRLVRCAVEKRLMADVPVGVYLSGGVDSSAITALMAEHSDRPVPTFSVAFQDEPAIDELGHARRVADAFGLDHHSVVLTDRDVIANLPEVIHHQDEPLADPVCVPLLALARLTRELNVKVVEVGEGSDELFLGYPVLAQVLRGERALRTANTLLPTRALSAAVTLMRPMLGDIRAEFMREAVRHGVPPAHGIAGLSERLKARLLMSRSIEESGHEYLRASFGSAGTASEAVRLALYHELTQRLPELLLMRVDKMTMAHSVEARVPFLDRDLVEFVTRLPPELQLAQGQGKHILKTALRGIVPDWVLGRRKQGFAAPVERWSQSLQPALRASLLRPGISEIFDPTVTTALLDAPVTPRRGFELWVLLNFALWHYHWIEGGDSRELLVSQDSATGGIPD